MLSQTPSLGAVSRSNSIVKQHATDRVLAGAVAQATIAICGSPTNKFYSAWYCTRSATARNIVSAVLPAILVTVWRSVVMPMVLYRWGLCVW